MRNKLSLILVTSAMLAACGGGGGDSPSSGVPTPNPVPVGTATVAFTVADGFIKATGGSVPLTVTKTGSGAVTWTIEGLAGATWVTSASAVSGTDSATITLAIAANTGAPRTASLTAVGSDGTRKTFIVEQTAARVSALRPTWSEVPVGWVMRYEDYLSVNKPYSVMLANAATDFRRVGSSSYRLEVRPGDCFSTDCTRTDGKRERSEYAQEGVRNKPGETFWYGWSMYVPDDYQEVGNVAGTSQTMTATQFMQSPTYEPSFMFGKQFGGNFAVRTFPTASGAPQQTFKLLDANKFAGHWHDFVVNATWTTANTGFFKVYVNGTLMMDYKGQTMTAGNDEVYFKYGVYRIASPTENINTVLFFDELRRAASRNEVDIRELEK